MSTPNDGGQAYPVTVGHAVIGKGMTLRDYFAAAALQGMLASSSPGQFSEADYAGAAYAQADAMLSERTKEAKS